MTKFLKLSALALLGSTCLSMTAMAATDATAFASKATIAGKFEIESSKIALERSKNSQIRGFAQRMIADHMKADKELKAVLPRAHVALNALPKTLDKDHQKIIDDLKAADANDFDAEYVDAQEDAHEEAVSLFEDYAKNGDNESLRKFAIKTLPTLKAHHEKIEALDDADVGENDKSVKQQAIEAKDKAVSETKDMGRAISDKAGDIKNDLTGGK